jgi:hypothetical protein
MNNFIQRLNDRKFYAGRVIMRMSVTGRGWRLHESSKGEINDVRQAITNFINENGEKYEN